MHRGLFNVHDNVGECCEDIWYDTTASTERQWTARHDYKAAMQVLKILPEEHFSAFRECLRAHKVPKAVTQVAPTSANANPMATVDRLNQHTVGNDVIEVLGALRSGRAGAGVSAK